MRTCATRSANVMAAISVSPAFTDHTYASTYFEHAAWWGATTLFLPSTVDRSMAAAVMPPCARRFMAAMDSPVAPGVRFDVFREMFWQCWDCNSVMTKRVASRHQCPIVDPVDDATSDVPTELHDDAEV